MGLVNQSTKPNGSTNWVDGDSVSGPGLSADMNTIYTEFNGNIDNANIKAAAAIVATKLASDSITNTQINSAAAIEPSKIDGFSDTNAESNTVSSPGDSSSNTLAATLQKELEQIRHAIKRETLGTGAKITNGTSSGLGADGNAAWFDGSLIGPSVIRNGAFLDATANGSANPPFGWTTVQTPSTLARVALDVGEGDGEAIHIVDDGGADCGISQTLIGLRASAKYLVTCRMKPITGTFRLSTTGATGTFGNLALVSASGGSLWQSLVGIIATDATPTNIVVTLAATSANAACHVAQIDCFPLGVDKIDRPRGFYRSRSVVTNSVATLESGTTTSVVVPGPGFSIVVSGLVSIEGANGGEAQIEIERSIDGGAFAVVERTEERHTNAGSTKQMVPVWWDEESPTIGSVYTFRLSATFIAPHILSSPAEEAHRIRVELKRL